MDRKKVLLLFGGESSEHEIAIASATNVNAAVDREEYEIMPTYIDKNGRWWLLDDFDQFSDYQSGEELWPVLGSGAFFTKEGRRVIPHVILPILHGKNGEDGSVQGLAQLLHIPIVGCDVTASAICMDKIATKEIMAAHDVAIVPYAVHHVAEPQPSFDELKDKLGLPLFVKPARAGSSVGVSKVTDEAELVAAVKEAHRHDKKVLIEQGMSIRELEVSVLGTPPQHRATLPGQINPGAEFYSYEDKYANESTSSVTIPAPLDDALNRRIQELGLKVYELLGCSGLARVDFFLTDDDKIYLNEINTLPGFTNISMYPKSWQQQDLAYGDLITALIEDALSNHATMRAE